MCLCVVTKIPNCDDDSAGRIMHIRTIHTHTHVRVQERQEWKRVDESDYLIEYMFWLPKQKLLLTWLKRASFNFRCSSTDLTEAWPDSQTAAKFTQTIHSHTHTHTRSHIRRINQKYVKNQKNCLGTNGLTDWLNKSFDIHTSQSICVCVCVSECFRAFMSTHAYRLCIRRRRNLYTGTHNNNNGWWTRNAHTIIYCINL